MHLNDTEQCGNCGEAVSPDAESVLYCSEEDGLAGEGPVCPNCLDRPDAETCAKCSAVYWTGVTPPYTEENAPLSVCGSCFELAVGGRD